MADVITRFRLETTQYDSKLRDASKELAEYTRQASFAGNEFGKFTQKNVEAARALGSIQSGATNAKDKVRDLVGAFNTAASAYNSLTKQQQQEDFAKALAESMQKLKGRISEAKQELYALGESGSSTGGIMTQLADKFVVNFDAMKIFNAGLAAAKGALQVLSDAFFASEANVDEWGRIMESSKSLYQGFLNAINTGDISGYLSRIDTIVQAARAAYNELDRLGTMRTIQAPQVSAQEAENERFRIMLRTGRYVAPLDGRTPSMPNGTPLRPDQLKQIEGFLESGMKTVVTLVGNEVQQAGRAIEALYKRQAAELGISLAEFRKGTSSMAEFEKRLEGYRKYNEFEIAHTIPAQYGGRNVRDNTPNPYAQYAPWGVFRVDGDRYGELVQLIQQRDAQASAVYGKQGQAYQAINRANGFSVRQLLAGGGGGGGGTHQPTPAEQAAGKFSAAEANYQQAVDFAAAQLKAKTITEQDYAKKILAAEESLWKAIAGARELADDPKYKTAQEEVEKRMAAQGVKISELTEQLEARRKAEREAEAAAREQAAAEKKLMEALSEAATAYGDNNLGGYLAAMKKVGGDAGQGIAAGGFTATTANLGSFQSLLREQLAGADIGSSLYASLSSQLADATTLGTLISAAVKNGIDVAQLPTQELWKKIFSENPGDYIDDSVWQGLVDKINEELKKIGKDPIQIDLKTGNIANVAKQTKDSWQDAARAVQAVGGALQQLEDPAAKVAGIVGQAIANIALGFAEATAKDSKLGVFGWIAAIAGGLGTMISTISAIKSATAGSYAEGGVIPGNSYSGDNQLALVNAGEIILNRAQQGNVAEGLMGNNIADLRLYTEVSGENLRVVLDNSSLRRGRGRYVTAKR